MAGKRSVPLLRHLIQAVHPRRRLFGHPLNGGSHTLPALWVGRRDVTQSLQDDAPLFRLGSGIEGRDPSRLLELETPVDEKRGIAAIVHDEVRTGAVRPQERLLRAPPVLLERLALPGEDGNPARVLRRPVRTQGGGRGGVILGREDVARDPAHVRPQIGQRLDENRRLHGHVQRAHHLPARQRLRVAVLGPHRHQSGHLVLGEADLLAAPLRQAQVGDLEGRSAGRSPGGGLGHVMKYGAFHRPSPCPSHSASGSQVFRCNLGLPSDAPYRASWRWRRRARAPTRRDRV